jgi:parallel beta-helix repeat protein
MRAFVACMVLLVFGPSLPANAAHSHRVRTASTVEAVVTTTRDILDGSTQSIASLNSDPGPDERISLREALLAAEATPVGEDLRVSFAIPTLDPGYDASTQTWLIRLGPGPNGAWGALLPPLRRGHVTIDGSTQAGAASAASVIVDGFDIYEAAGQNVGFLIESASNTLRSLALINFYDTAIVLNTPNATSNQIQGMLVNVSARGPAQLPSYSGLDIRGGAQNNQIGGPTPQDRNLFAASSAAGVQISGAGTRGNHVTGNWIGLALDGTALGNATGIAITDHASANQIGLPGAGNVIGGNENGLYIDNAAQNSIVANLVGLAPDGVSTLPNGNGGIYLVNGSQENQIGGALATERNVISANGAQGIYISDPGSNNNRVQGNYIGVDSSGLRPRGNIRQGVLISYTARNNTIGGTSIGEGNVIAYNGLGGIRIDAPANVVAGNLIGIGADATTSLGNQNHGIRIGGDDNVIGPNNTIANNQASGIIVTGRFTNILGNRLSANAISGVCVTGSHTRIIGNDIIGNGGSEQPSSDCTVPGGVSIIGTATLVANNVVRDNRTTGIAISAGQANTITANSITGNQQVGIALRQGGNGAIEPPLLSAVEPELVSGSACSTCTVEIFADSGDQGGEMIGTTQADVEGQFILALTRSITNTNVTATHTDASGNTSQFALAKGVRALGRLYFLELPAVIVGAVPDPLDPPAP